MITLNRIVLRCRSKAILFVVFFSALLFGQTGYEFERYTMGNGLSDNSVNTLIQTKDGFIWAGTTNGLNRFDGKKFKVYRNNPIDSTTIPENNINCLFEDSKGNLWIGTWGGGLLLFDRSRNKFIQYKNEAKDSLSLRSNFIQCMYEDSRGRLLIGTQPGGLNVYNAESRTFSHLYEWTDVFSICEYPAGTYWIGTSGFGLVQLSKDFKQINVFQNNEHDPKSIISNSVLSILPLSDSLLILGFPGGVHTVNVYTGTIGHSFNEKMLYRTLKPMLKDSKGRLWIGSGSYNGLYEFTGNGSSYTLQRKITAQADDDHSPLSDHYGQIIEDKSGNIWFATGSGINKLTATKPFRQYGDLPYITQKRKSRTVSKIIEDRNGNLWIGYGGGGTKRVNMTTGDTAAYQYIGNDPLRVDENDITDIYEDRSGTIWIATRTTGLSRWNKTDNSFTWYVHNPNDPSTIRSNNILVLNNVNDTLFIIGTEYGLDVMNRFNGTFKRFDEYVSQYTSKDNIGGLPYLYDRKGNLWLGPHRYNLVTHEYTVFPVDKLDSTTLGVQDVITIFQDSKERIWFCTFGGGLHRYLSETNTFKRYTEAEGMPSNIVYSIEEDAKGNLWLGTRQGLVRFNPEKETMRTFTKEDGLIDNEFFWRSSCKDSQGHLLFGGVDGLIIFHPEELDVDSLVPSVTLTSMKVFDKEFPFPASFHERKQIDLEYQWNFFSIEFAALDFLPHEKDQFKYKLDGFEEQWQEADETMTAKYTDVHPGQYDFYIQARNRDGVWGAPQNMATIIIIPAFWMTWWFKTSVVLLILAMMYSLYRYRLMKIVELQNVRMKIAGDLHDEIGSNLSGIAIAAQMKARNNSFTEEERREFMEIGQTAIQTASSMRDIVWFINPQNDSTENLLMKMKDTAKALLKSMDVTFTENHSVQITLPLELRRQLFLIYKEALHNIAKHSGATKVSIRLEEVQSVIELQIQDNGKGFDPAARSNGNGLGNMNRRAKECHGELLVETNFHGTILTLKIPRATNYGIS